MVGITETKHNKEKKKKTEEEIRIVSETLQREH